MKVIVSAYDCAPDTGSESGVGWNWVLQIARGDLEVDVITAVRNRERIEASDDHRRLPITFHYLEPPVAATRLSQQWGWLYYAWQRALAGYARDLHRTRRFDIAHHLTYGTDWMPSGLAGLDIPFVWGPVGGSSHHLPPGIELPPDAVRAERQRRVLQTSVKRVDPYYRRTVADADRIIVYSKEAMAGIPAAHRDRVSVVTHIGVGPDDLPADYLDRRQAHLAELESPQPPSDTDADNTVVRPLRVLTGGRLVHWKGYDLLVEGLGRHRQRTGADTRLTITAHVNSTPEGRAMIDNLIADHDLGHAITMRGHLPTRDDVYRELAASDLYALATWRDGPPTSVLEAMHGAVATLVLDLGAPAELVPDHAGFKVAMGTRDQIIDGIADAFTQADKDRPALAEMGRNGRQHAQAYHSWDRIGAAVHQIYRDLLARRRD